MKSSIHRALLVTSLFLGACDPESPAVGGPDSGPASTSVALADVAAHPARYVDQTLRVVGTPTYRVACTAAACSDPTVACNACNGSYTLGGPNGISIWASDAFVPTVAAYPTMPPLAGLAPTTVLGCVGSEREEICAPVLPRAIVAMTGTVTAWMGSYVFRVDSIESDPSAPTSEPCGTSWPSCVRSVSTVPHGLDGGVGDAAVGDGG
ncbi:MAG: hypothetical protein U0230_26920 [Polyangiales bacterium]